MAPELESLADLPEPPDGLDWARPGDMVAVTEDDGETVLLQSVVESSWTRPRSPKAADRG